MDAPRMTYYARIIDNLDDSQITGFKDTKLNSNWNYGQCDGLIGGESQYIVEFDIWNNEPAFNAGTYDVAVQNAINCKLSVLPNGSILDPTSDLAKLFNLSNPFVYARCTTFSYTETWVGIKINDNPILSQYLEEITGNVSPLVKGTILGDADHAIVQTKIILPANSNIDANRYNFNLVFYYDYQ